MQRRMLFFFVLLTVALVAGAAERTVLLESFTNFR